MVPKRGDIRMNQKIWGFIAAGLTLTWLFIMSQPLVGVFTGFQVLGTGTIGSEDSRSGVMGFSLMMLLLVASSILMALVDRDKK